MVEKDRRIAADDRSRHLRESISQKATPETATSRGLTSRQARFILDETSGWGLDPTWTRAGQFPASFPRQDAIQDRCGWWGLMAAMVGVQDRRARRRRLGGT